MGARFGSCSVASGNPDSNQLTSGKPTGKAKSAPANSHSVKFVTTPEDQSLLQAVQQAMTDRSLSFSDLCKLALQQMLTANPAHLPLLALLEQQIMALQLQVMQLEQRPTHGLADAELRQQLQDLSQRVAQLEQQTGAAAEPQPEVDPLLARMAPLLEEF